MKTTRLGTSAPGAAEVDQGFKDADFVPFRAKLEEAARDPIALQLALAELGANSSHRVADMQAGLASMLQARASRTSLLQTGREDSKSTQVASEAVKKHVTYDHLMAGLAEGTGGMMAKAINDESIDEKDLMMTALPALATAAGMANPVLGVAATFGVALIGGLLGGSSDGPSLTDVLAKWKTQIMTEVRGMVDEAILQQTVELLESELLDLFAEMDWVPQMLESTDAAQAKVAYYLTFQTHLASLKNRIFKGECISKAMTFCDKIGGKTSCNGNIEYRDGYRWKMDTSINGDTFNVGAWGYRDQADCVKWAKSGVPATLGLLLSDLHLDVLEKIWENDAALRPNLKERMKYQIHEYGNTLHAYLGAMVDNNVAGHWKFAVELKHWMESLLYREKSIWGSYDKRCVGGLLRSDGRVLYNYHSDCRRRSGPTASRHRSQAQIPYYFMRAYQSSTYDHESIPSRALTSSPRTTWPGTCTHTHRQSGAWWKVSLSGTWHVTSVRLTSTAHCCPDRLQNIGVRVGSTWCARGVYVAMGATKTVECDAYGSEIFVQHLGTNYLQLCGFSAFGSRIAW